ncbi:65-kDa microtubule-associated protein 5 [Dendrobium catenatum]|uniref:65-kDa microtubule-associated protein 2 n=1 Tax=Dendrobium catenatum TaxID=906689 RepID=A0A2I0X5P5_9ASPA|nr:65-kDa microtubule-associated protein 5 [Dendrobium catenatum]XP_028549358.1 65-kDa microtubule-associated protein 5 [Dendrobium catenatum]PKU83239.1 65-kDa microtubule-associated protein 2 [Dendrobium catenatum]
MTSLSQYPIEAPMEATSCGSLLKELQILWDDIGETDLERDRMILQLEQECLNVYRKKVDQERKHKAYLVQSLAEGEVEVSKIISSLGELGQTIQLGKQKCTLKEQLSKIDPLLKDLRRRKEERAKEFLEVQLQIVHICTEISGDVHSSGSACPQVDERDLTLKRLGELKCQLLELQKEKNTRLQKVNDHIKTIYELCSILSNDYNKTLLEVHPSFVDAVNTQSKSISNETLARLAGTINSLKQEKTHRLQKLQGLASMLIELWNLMDIAMDERNKYDHVTMLISASSDDVLGHGCLSMDVIDQVELEVGRLNILKVTKMKELVLKKQDELEEIYRGVHMDFDSDAARQRIINIINSGKADLSVLLSDMDNQISMAQEQAARRKDILERVEKWIFACQEENWLDEYERDQNRYSAGRGAHINLKRAEKARLLVSKIPSLLETLTAKVKAWESDKGACFLYDKKSLLETLDEYAIKKQQRDDERRRSREHKRLQEQYATEQEVLFGTKPSPLRNLSAKKPLGQSNLNLQGGTPVGRRFSTHLSRPVILSNSKDKKDGNKVATAIPLNFVALSKDC